MKKMCPKISNTHYWTKRIFPLIVILSLLSGCYIPIAKNQEDNNYAESISGLTTNAVDILFQLEITESINENETIVLEIVDDFTGLPDNNQRYELTKRSDQDYYTIISVPSGSVIKYRYAKISDSLILESTPDGEPVRYRLYFANEHATVTDILQAWQGEGHRLLVGTITGTIVDQDTKQPIPDILVSAGGRQTFTDANGKYQLLGIGQGVHNVVFYAMDGKYRTYQQGAMIEAGKRTPADVKLHQSPEVSITFLVTPPNDAIGAPVFMAGNISQFGNTFADLQGSMSIKPKRMPMLTQQSDGTLALTKRLYAETDLRYKFTLGNGYWNAEQTNLGNFQIRQLIVPSNDITINHTIETWRSPGVEPITFLVDVPPATSPFDSKFIQFGHADSEEWTEPIPLWPIGNHRYLYILFSPLNTQNPINYQFCRNEDCVHARDNGSVNNNREVLPTDTSQTIELSLDSWQNWYPLEKNISVLEAFIPSKPPLYNRMIELAPNMDPSWLYYVPRNIKALNEGGVDTIVFSPQWTVFPNSPYLHPDIGTTPFYCELMTILQAAHSDGFNLALFPQIDFYDLLEILWNSTDHTDTWWEIFFSSYRDFILNYAKIAQDSNSSQLILGGKALLPAFYGGIFPDGTPSSVPSTSNDVWIKIIDDIQTEFDGKLIWATNMNQKMDPLPDFIDKFDEIYISVDSPLALGDDPTFEMIQSGFTGVIDNHIYEVYRSTQKPITLGLAYPAVEKSASGCALLNEACFNDGLFSADEIKPYIVDMQEQSLVYNAIFPIIASRDWITGTSIRGYNPTVVIYDGSSSIAGKPAFDVVQYWYTNLKP